MRELPASTLTETIKRLCIQANCHLPADVRTALGDAQAAEPWPPATEILDRICQNYQIADDREMPICQDTGVACVFLEIGQEVHIAGDLRAAVDEGVRQGYQEG